MTRRSEAAFLEALRSRGASGLSRVRFRENRSTLWSLTGAHTVLNLHVGYREAPAELLDDLALLVRHPRGGPPGAREARRRVREHAPTLEAVRRIRTNVRSPAARRPGSEPAPVPAVGPNCATPSQQRYLERTYRQLNAALFAALLPADLPLRLSRRMRSTRGWVTLGLRGGTRIVGELALNLDLMLEANDALRREVLLHEMAHVEAWLQHGDRGHGPAWRRIALRVGCRPRARGSDPLARRSGSRAKILRVPPPFPD